MLAGLLECRSPSTHLCRASAGLVGSGQDRQAGARGPRGCGFSLARLLRQALQEAADHADQQVVGRHQVWGAVQQAGLGDQEQQPRQVCYGLRRIQSGLAEREVAGTQILCASSDLCRVLVQTVTLGQSSRVAAAAGELTGAGCNCLTGGGLHRSGPRAHPTLLGQDGGVDQVRLQLSQAEQLVQRLAVELQDLKDRLSPGHSDGQLLQEVCDPAHAGNAHLKPLERELCAHMAAEACREGKPTGTTPAQALLARAIPASYWILLNAVTRSATKSQRALIRQHRTPWELTRCRMLQRWCPHARVWVFPRLRPGHWHSFPCAR